jgi:hypothetical protein
VRERVRERRRNGARESLLLCKPHALESCVIIRGGSPRWSVGAVQGTRAVLVLAVVVCGACVLASCCSRLVFNLSRQVRQESRCFWFSATALENAREFNLIGKVFGLAIYNSVILDVHFPMVVYKKLMGNRPKLEDLEDCNPQLARGLKMVCFCVLGVIAGSV